MPNHIHGILLITANDNTNDNVEKTVRFGDCKSGSLSTIINRYKGAVTRQISQARNQETQVWQRGFHEHVIRNERELENIRRYIIENPLHWADDEHYQL